MSPKPIKILLIKIADIGKINLSNEILLTKEKYVFESRQKAAVNTEKDIKTVGKNMCRKL